MDKIQTSHSFDRRQAQSTWQPWAAIFSRSARPRSTRSMRQFETMSLIIIMRMASTCVAHQRRKDTKRERERVMAKSVSDRERRRENNERGGERSYQGYFSCWWLRLLVKTKIRRYGCNMKMCHLDGISAGVAQKYHIKIHLIDLMMIRMKHSNGKKFIPFCPEMWKITDTK